MQLLYEQVDILNAPYEAFYFDTAIHASHIKTHWHYYVEIIYILEGNIKIECAKKEYDLNSGQMLFIHPQTIHSIYTKPGGRGKFCALKFDIFRLSLKSSYTPKLSAVFRLAKGNPDIPILFSDEDFPFLSLPSLFEGLVWEVDHREYGYDILFQARASSLLIEILRLWRKKGFQIDQPASDLSETDSLYEILEYIDHHSHEPIRVKDLAERCHMSYSHFAKTFRLLYGQSCKTYLESVRLSKAEDLLLFTDYDLNYISQETGFADSSHLIRIFRQKYDITPKQYRLKHRS